MKTITMDVEFAGVSARRLFDTYVTSDLHARATQAEAVVGDKAGDEFRVFGGGVKGRNLAVVDGRMIVQTWRGRPWQDTDLDSVLVLAFSDTPSGAKIELSQANIPDQAYPMVNEAAWHDRYWRSWQDYFAASSGER
jgi:activator of HSP90 ATPase